VNYIHSISIIKKNASINSQSYLEKKMKSLIHLCIIMNIPDKPCH
jgi:hypothetical protein